MIKVKIREEKMSDRKDGKYQNISKSMQPDSYQFDDNNILKIGGAEGLEGQKEVQEEGFWLCELKYKDLKWKIALTKAPNECLPGDVVESIMMSKI